MLWVFRCQSLLLLVVRGLMVPARSVLERYRLMDHKMNVRCCGALVEEDYETFEYEQ